jgi:hypothetical protein
MKNITIDLDAYNNEYGHYLGFPVALWDTERYYRCWPYPEAVPYDCIEFNHWMYGSGSETDYQYITSDAISNNIDL